MKRFLPVILFSLVSLLLFSCAGTKNYSPATKYPQKSLRKDYSLLRQILEKKHPSLYWYTPQDSMNFYFDHYYAAIKDSMTEQQFTWHILAPLVDKINCGHTSVGSSKTYRKWVQGKTLPSFPLYFKVWGDTMAVSGNLNRRDSIFKRGTIVTAVNGLTTKQLIDRIFNYLPQDGYANNLNYIRLSANFPYYHRNIFGLSTKYKVTYLDSRGVEKTTAVPLWAPVRDTTKRPADSIKRPREPRPPKIPKEKRLESLRSFKLDSSGLMATMTLNTFSNGKLRSFFRSSFKKMRQQNIPNLILDVRSNGGGKVMNSTLLTKYLSRTPFKVADSVYAVSRGVGPYGKYVKGGFFNSIEMFFISKKKKDGNYHIGHLERKLYKPKNKNHYDGKVYVLINGPSFSATSLVCNVLKGQKDVLLVGEETGGGWHGNSGIMIPDIKLPHTKTTVRLPLFRLVQYNHIPKTGTGVVPDWYIGTSYDALLKGYDHKMREVRDRIIKDASSATK
ncbi:MAG: peptidase S41 [Rhizobacter sp.]|nr:peptidase S41 [Ferruginibacter sp.]